MTNRARGFGPADPPSKVAVCAHLAIADPRAGPQDLPLKISHRRQVDLSIEFHRLAGEISAKLTLESRQQIRLIPRFGPSLSQLQASLRGRLRTERNLADT